MSDPSPSWNLFTKIGVPLLMLAVSIGTGVVSAQGSDIRILDKRVIAIESNRHTQAEREQDREEVRELRIQTDQKFTQILITLEGIASTLKPLPNHFPPDAYKREVDAEIEELKERVIRLELKEE